MTTPNSTPRRPRTISGVLALAYGGLAYLAFGAAFLALVVSLGHFGHALELDWGTPTPLATAVIVDLGLVLLFGVTHSVMARPGFKRRWTRVVPPALERSTFVLVASLCLVLLVWQWRPISGRLWQIEGGWGRHLLNAVYLLGWGITLVSSFLIDHFDLFGLRQVTLYYRGRPYTHVPFRARFLYRVVRHPMMVGLILAFWATPVMSWGRLLLASGMTAYIAIGLIYEERDLSKALGERYRTYLGQVPMLIPRLRRWRPDRRSTGAGLPDTAESGSAE